MQVSCKVGDFFQKISELAFVESNINVPVAHCQIRILSDKLKMRLVREKSPKTSSKPKKYLYVKLQKTPGTIESTVFGKYFVTFFTTHPYPSIIHIVSLPFALHHPYPLADIYAFLKAS